MYRCLEIIFQEILYFYQGNWHRELPFKSGILGASDTSWVEKLRGPKKSIPPNTRFFFTEKGWREVGRHIVAQSKSNGQGVRVFAVKESSVNVVWGDEYEVATQPKQSRPKEGNWYY